MTDAFTEDEVTLAEPGTDGIRSPAGAVLAVTTAAGGS